MTYTIVIRCLLLTHWGRETHICISKQTIIGSDNGLSPGRRQAIIWTNFGILLNGTLGTTFCEILIEIRIFSFKKMGLKVSSAKWRPFCLGLNVLNSRPYLHETTSTKTNPHANISERFWRIRDASIWEKILLNFLSVRSLTSWSKNSWVNSLDYALMLIDNVL